MTIERDRDVVVTNSGGSGAGTIIGVVVAVLLILAVLWFAFGSGMMGGGHSVTNVNVNLPALPSITVPQPSK